MEYQRNKRDIRMFQRREEYLELPDTKQHTYILDKYEATK